MSAPEIPQIVVNAPPTTKRRREFSATPPKFSIMHGYLWVTFAGIFLAAVQARAHQAPGIVGIAITSGLSMLIGAAWSLSAILIYRWWQATPWLCEPGHWFGAAVGFRYALSVLLSLYFGKFIPNEQPIGEMVMSSILLLPLFSRRQSVAWKVVFGLLSMLCLMPNLLAFLRLAFPLSTELFASVNIGRRTIIPLMAISVVAIYAIWERARGVRRDWLHAVGILVWILCWIVAVSLPLNG